MYGLACEVHLDCRGEDASDGLHGLRNVCQMRHKYVAEHDHQGGVDRKLQCIHLQPRAQSLSRLSVRVYVRAGVRAYACSAPE